MTQERTYRTMCDKSIGKCASGHWLPLKGDCDLCGATPYGKCRYTSKVQAQDCDYPLCGCEDHSEPCRTVALPVNDRSSP